jgi:hypothetical protein
MKIHARWTTEVRDEDIQPRGRIESLQDAVSFLGPFERRLNAEAEKFGPWGGPRKDTPLSEEYAYEQVFGLAILYNRHALLDSNAPRVKNLMNELGEIETASGELARLIEQSSDETRRILCTAGTGVGRFLMDWTSPLCKAADVSGLPRPAAAERPAEKSGWAKRLQALSEYCCDCQRTYLISRGINSIDAADRGGNTNLYREQYGTARWFLAKEGWFVHELFKPGTSKGTDGGSFHRFLLATLEYAIDRPPDEEPSLMPNIKLACKVNRQHQDIAQRESALIEEQAALDTQRTKLGLKAFREREAELEAKLLAIHQEYYDLWPELYPFAK